MSKNDSYIGGSTTFHLGSDWVAKNKRVDAETVFKRERKAEAAKKATEEWLAETAPNQDPDRQRENMGSRSREILRKKPMKKGDDDK